MKSSCLLLLPLLILLLSFAYLTMSTQDTITELWNPWWVEFRNLTGCRRGDNTKGIDIIKRHFNQFRYLNEGDNPTFTDEFDAHLEGAIRTYQENFDLKVTGILDGETVEQLSQPRCGIKDIINGSSSMNSGRRLTSNIGHSVARYSFFPGQPRWRNSRKNLSYAFLASKSPFSLSDLRPIFARSFGRWADVTSLTFWESSADSSSADIKISFASGDHGDGEVFDGKLGTLAHAFSPESGRLHFDADEKWAIDSVGLSDSESVDLESVAVHEIGHLLGLGHSSVKESVMFPTLQTRKKKLSLASDDVQGIQRLYGQNPNGSSIVPRQEREQTGAGRSLVAGRLLLHPFVSFMASISLLLPLL